MRHIGSIWSKRTLIEYNPKNNVIFPPKKVRLQQTSEKPNHKVFLEKITST